MQTTEQIQQELDELRSLLKLTNNELEETRYQLEEANDTIEAIRRGEIDALVVKVDDNHQLYSLKNSDQAYRIFIEQMTTGAVTLNSSGHVIYCNSRFASIVNTPLEKVIGRSFISFVSSAYIPHFEEQLSKAWQSGLSTEIQLFADNIFVPVLLSLQTLGLDEGLSMSVIVTDLTEQKYQENLLKEKNAELTDAQQVVQELNSNLEQTVRERTQKLYEQQERLTRVLETMAEGVCIIDLSGKLLYANAMANKLLGIDHVNGSSFSGAGWQLLLLTGEGLEDAAHPMMMTMEDEKAIYDFEIAVQSPNDDKLYVSINATPLRDEKGAVRGSIGTFMDVTNRKKIIQQKDEFISVASHELRTPITTLKASLQLLDRMKHQPSAAILPTLIEQANKSLNKVSILVSELLNATKVTQGHLELAKTPFVLRDLINECCDSVRSQGHHSIVVEGDNHLQVVADRFRIEQVLVNFVNNAVKYAPGSKEIIISFEQIASAVKVSVKDFGPGIPPEKLPHLFDRYYQGAENGKQYSGLGLGLYIAAEIIRKHGGEIGVESHLGEGSIFWFTIPNVTATS